MCLLAALLLTLQEPHPLPQRAFSTRAAWIADDLNEIKDLVDWLAKHEFNALQVGGLADGHAKELARYARAKGVALIAEMPSLPGLCTAKAEGRDRLRAALEKLRELDVDGVRLDVPDAGLACGCAEHLSVYAGLALDVLKPRRVSYAAANHGERLKLLPEACVAEWEAAGTSPVKHNVLRLSGGGWGHAFRRREAEGLWRAFDPSLEEIRVFAAGVRASGYAGAVLGRGASPKSPDAELAALAFIDFTRDPALTIDGFLKRHVPRLYGDAAAEEVVKLLLAQPAVHAKAAPFWRGFDGRWPAGDAKEVAAALAAQLALARSAAAKASADGKRRLDAIAAILGEYHVICEAAGISDKAKLAEAYEKAGLPDEIYRYKGWK